MRAKITVLLVLLLLALSGSAFAAEVSEYPLVEGHGIARKQVGYVVEDRDGYMVYDNSGKLIRMMEKCPGGAVKVYDPQGRLIGSGRVDWQHDW